MKKYKLDMRGVAHLVAPLIVIVGVGAVGAYLLVRSHADTPGPSVTIQSPANNNAFPMPGTSDPTAVSVSASDNTGVNKVELYVDGALNATSTTTLQGSADDKTASFVLNASQLSPGQHTFVAKAYNTEGNVGTSSSVTVIRGYRFTPLTPARIADTRTGSGQPYAGQTIGAGKTLNIQVEGRGGVPASGVSAVTVNVTTASTTAGTYLTVFPTGGSLPKVSTVNANAGQVANNQTIATLSANGQLSIYNSSGNTNVVVDVLGYYSDSGNYYHTISPMRLVDTRSTNVSELGGKTIGAGQTLTFSGTGLNGAVAETLNVTVVSPAGGGYLTVYPAGGARPTTSTVNFGPGQVLAKEVTTKVGSNYSFSIYNSSASPVNVIVDLEGGYSPYLALMYVPVTPARIVDTRAGSGSPYAGKTMGANGTLGVQMVGAVPAPARAVETNLTIVNASTSTALVAYPTGAAIPGTSSINAVPGGAYFNQMSTALSSSGSFNLHNGSGTADAIIDLLGYYL